MTSLVLGVASFFAAGWFRLAALLAIPHAGSFGTTEADLHFTPEQYEEFESHARSLHAWSTTLNYLSFGLVAASVVATAWCAIQTWRAVRHWHWPSFVGLTCLLALVIAGDGFAASKPAMLGLLALDDRSRVRGVRPHATALRNTGPRRRLGNGRAFDRGRRASLD